MTDLLPVQEVHFRLPFSLHNRKRWSLRNERRENYYGRRKRADFMAIPGVVSVNFDPTAPNMVMLELSCPVLSDTRREISRIIDRELMKIDGPRRDVHAALTQNGMPRAA